MTEYSRSALVQNKTNDESKRDGGLSERTLIGDPGPPLEELKKI